MLAAGLVALIHAARSEAGTRWLLGHVPGLTVSGVQGSLVGESLRIESLQWHGSATQPVLQIDGIELQQPQWRLLPFTGGWVGLSARSLTASRVVFASPRESTPGSGEPPPLHWPLALRIDAVTVAELQLDDAAPWLDVRGSVRLGDNDGTEHRIEGLSLHNDRLQLSADARIGTTAPLPLALQLQAKPVSGTPWQATRQRRRPAHRVRRARQLARRRAQRQCTDARRAGTHRAVRRLAAGIVAVVDPRARPGGAQQRGTAHPHRRAGQRAERRPRPPRAGIGARAEP